jgi:hypothetical protein
VNIEEIKAELKRLIEKRKTIDEKTSEANICATFVEPLFSFLGWNTLDIKQVDRQSYVRGAGYPDVALKIDNKPAIFVEVKKIGKIPKNRIDPQAQMTLPLKELADLIDRTPEEKQAFKYARGQQIDWAILTNFDCLFVYNANQEQIVLSFKTPEEYLERFDDLLWLSREKVKAKSLEWLQNQLKKEEIDKGFLEKLKNWRVTLAQNIYSENGDNHILKDDRGEFDLEKLMGIVQRILSRLLIIQIADDREVLKKHNLLENLINTYENLGDYATKDHLLKKFIDLSEMMDQHHNTTIFTPGHPCDKVFISNGVLDKIITELCHISFRKMTADILGATYESYLGYRFSLKNGRIEAEVDQRVRKQAGIYYTPSYIVRYIVDNTLGVKLKELEDQYGLEAGEKAKDLKILDPACGSGSFLIYAFDVLANFYERTNEKIRNEQVRLTIERGNPDIFEMRERLKNLPPTVSNYPKRILEDHLYGVDLDPAACEIATINLVIKAFEKIKDKKLPLILNQNVKVGNSLISGVEKKEDLEKFKDEIAKHIELRRRLKEAEEDEEKQELMKQIDQLREKVNLQLNESLKKYFDQPEEKRPFNWEFEFPEVFDSEKPEEEKGFEVVIGNPPYLLMQISNTPKEVLDYVESNFKVAQYKIDSYHLFLEKAISLLNLNGVHSFIVPNTFLINKHTNRLREYILSLCMIKNISMIPETVFESAEVDNCIVVFKRQENAQARSENEVAIFDFETKRDGKISILPIGQIKQKIFEEQQGYVFNVNLASAPVDIGSKIQHNSVPLGSLLRVYFGIQTFDRKKYVSDRRVDKTYKRALDGEDIQRYRLTSKERYVKFVPSAIKSGGDPKVHFAKEKIIVLQIGSEPRGTLDIKKRCTLNTIYNLTPKKLGKYSLKYTLAIINSKVITSFWRMMFWDRKQLFPKIKKRPLESIPVHAINFANPTEKAKHDQMVKYVDIMLERNKQKNKLLEIFEQVLKNHTHEQEPFGKAYYEKAEYIEKIDKKAEAIASSTDEVSKIFLEEKGNTLIFSVLIKGERKEALRLKIADEDFRLFLFYSVRKYLEENKRRKKWTTKSLPKVLDMILGRLEVPVFKSSGKIHDPRYNLRMINLVMKEFKTKFQRQFPKGNIHLSQIEKEIQDTDNSIDALVFKLYDLNKEEVATILDSMETPDTIKKDILKKFEAMK